MPSIVSELLQANDCVLTRLRSSDDTTMPRLNVRANPREEISDIEAGLRSIHIAGPHIRTEHGTVCRCRICQKASSFAQWPHNLQSGAETHRTVAQTEETGPIHAEAQSEHRQKRDGGDKEYSDNGVESEDDEENTSSDGEDENEVDIETSATALVIEDTPAAQALSVEEMWPIQTRDPLRSKSGAARHAPQKSHKKLPKSEQRANKERRKERVQVRIIHASNLAFEIDILKETPFMFMCVNVPVT